MIEPVLATLVQWSLFAGVSFVVGCVAWRLVVAPGAMRLLSGAEALAMDGIERRMARAGAVTGFVLLGTWGLRLVVQVMGFRDPFVPLWDDVSFLLFETFWGSVWMGQGVILPLLVVAFWLAATRGGEMEPPVLGVAAAPHRDADQSRDRLEERRRERAGGRGRDGVSAGWWAATVLTLMLVASLALSSHAMGVESWRPVIVVADGVHALAAGVWIGALGLILTVARPRSGAQSEMDLFAAQIRSFSPMAIASVAALVAMGVVLSWTHLTRVSDLWTMNYGRILMAKTALTGGVLAAGFINWRRGIPALSTEGGARAIWRRGMLEVYLAVAVLLLTALLVHSVKPS